MSHHASDRFEQALRFAAEAHRDQVRRGTGVPYITHPVAVARIVERAGGPEDAVIAALLHDVVEDTAVELDEIIRRFGIAVAAAVADCSEVKVDARGRERPWEDRKRDFLATLGSVGPESGLVILADKLHNLQSIRLDLAEGRAVWESFRAPRDRVLWYHGEVIKRLGRRHANHPAISELASACLNGLAAVSASRAENDEFSVSEG